MTADTNAWVKSFLLVGVNRGSGLMRSETNGLRAQTTTSPLSCKAGYAVVEVFSGKKKTHQAVVFARCSRSWLSVSSLCYHGWVVQEPNAGGHSSVDVFWESRWVDTNTGTLCFYVTRFNVQRSRAWFQFPRKMNSFWVNGGVKLIRMNMMCFHYVVD